MHDQMIEHSVRPIWQNGAIINVWFLFKVSLKNQDFIQHELLFRGLITFNKPAPQVILPVVKLSNKNTNKFP